MFRRQRPHDDFSEEIHAHIELETDRRVAEGMSREDARAAALRAFGSVTRAKERFYEAGRWVWLEQALQDVRYAARTLAQSPSFLATAVLTLAVGIGLITVAFSVMNAYVLRPYAVRDPYSLHKIRWMSQQAGGPLFKWRDFEAIRERRELFDDVLAESTRFISSEGRPLAAALVSDNYFDMLGPAVAFGRGLGRADRDGAAESIVLSHQAWMRLFGGDAAALGRTLDLNGRPFTVVGILRPGFAGIGDSPRDLWMPFTTFAALFQPAMIGPNQPATVELIARLRSGVTPQQAGAALTPLVAAAVGRQDGVRAEVVPQSSPNPMSVQLLAVLLPVFAAFALVLATACANVSNVMLARAIARQREIAVRLSLGASRWRIIRQLLTEGIVIAALAGAAGLALAYWTLRAGTALVMGTLPPSVAALVRLAPTPFDSRVFVFALIVAALTTVMFALLPSLQASRLRLTDALRGHATGARRGARMRSVLVGGQVAVSLVLVVVALTLERTGSAIASIDPGYDTAGVLSINVRGESPAALVAGLRDVLAADPRVAQVAATGGNPLFVRSRDVAAAPAGAASAQPTRYTFVSPEYFEILRVPINRGRAFTADEARAGAPVAIVSEATAASFWPNGEAIGKVIRIVPPQGRPVDELPGYSEVTVIGTVRDLVSGLLMDGRDPGHIYLPADARRPQAIALLARGRTARDLGPESLAELFRRAGPDPEVFEALPLDEMRALQMYPLHAASSVGSFLGAVALVLSVSGLYGVLSYALSQRTREIGIRVALGATASAVVRLVMLQSARVAGAGALAGGVVAFVALHVLNSAIHLRTASLLSVPAFAGSLVLVLASAALAAYQPARRAARVDPAQTLRADA
jgi:predicted permease